MKSENQKTEYKYKVIVHDDASTDDTPLIIKKYAEKYPDLIIPIYQKENQYQKKIGIYENYIAPHLEGKYVAICEGDDFWCDENKLQIQIDYMENNPNCSLCVHNTMMIDNIGKEKGITFNKSKYECEYETKDVIESGGGGLFHTSSFVYRKDIRVKKPVEFKMTGIGDYPLAMYLAMNGQVHYFPEIMSKYRVGSVNSWVKKNNSSIDKMKEIANIHIMDLKKLDEITNFQYSDSFEIAKKRIEYDVLIRQGKLIKILFHSEYRKFYFENSLKSRIKIVLKILLQRVR